MDKDIDVIDGVEFPFLFCFFFSSRRRHTRSLCDWSSDVCSSDLITGAGTISPAGALDFKMIANLHGGMVGGVTKMAALGGNKDSGIPFSITGTTTNPSFVPDVAGVGGG